MLFQAISGYIGLSQAIMGYQITSIWVQVEAGESKLLQFETWKQIDHRQTLASYRGACAPKNGHNQPKRTITNHDKS